MYGALVIVGALWTYLGLWVWWIFDKVVTMLHVATTKLAI
jgi:hypothetical protein